MVIIMMIIMVMVTMMMMMMIMIDDDDDHDDDHHHHHDDGNDDDDHDGDDDDDGDDGGEKYVDHVLLPMNAQAVENLQLRKIVEMVRALQEGGPRILDWTIVVLTHSADPNFEGNTKT